MTKEITTDIRNWMIKRKFKLIEYKTECMMFGNENVLKVFEQLPYVEIRPSDIETIRVISNLGTFMVRNLTMKSQILKKVKICD